MADTPEFLSHTAHTVGNYVADLAADIWHGQALEKHPYAMAIGSLALAGVSGGWLLRGALRTAAEGAAAFSETAAQAAATSTGVERSFVDMLAQGELDAPLPGNAEAVLRQSMPADLFTRVMGQPGAEYESLQTLPRSAAKQAESLVPRATLAQTDPKMYALGKQSEMFSNQYVSALKRGSGHVGSTDSQTVVARMYESQGWKRDIVVRHDAKQALEQVLKPTPGGQLEIAEWRHLDFGRRMGTSYLFRAGQGVLRSTVVNGEVSTKVLGEDAAMRELGPIANNIFYRSSSGADITGIHSQLSI